MKFCTLCGTELTNGVCPNCSSLQKGIPKKHPNSKKNKFLLIAFSILMLLLISGFFCIKSSINTEAEVASIFINSISNKNTDNLQEILYSEDAGLSINKENSLILINYFSNNPYEFSSLQDNFKSNNFDVSSSPFSIKEVDKKFLIFPVYKVVITPTFIKVQSDLDNATIRIGDDISINLSERKEIGPLFPGEYTITAELSTSYLNKSEVFSVNTYNSPNESITPFTDLTYINITSDMPNADLYVNDKSTGIKIKDAQNFGPVEPTSLIYAISTEGDKKLISNKYSAQFNSNLYINFNEVKSEEEDFKMSLYNLLYNYSSSFAYAVNYNNFSYISNYLEIGSPIYSKQREVISKIHYDDITEGFESTEILNYSFNKDTNEGNVTCYEIYSIAVGRNVPKRREFTNTYNFKMLPNGTLVLTDIY